MMVVAVVGEFLRGLLLVLFGPYISLSRSTICRDTEASGDLIRKERAFELVKINQFRGSQKDERKAGIRSGYVFVGWAVLNIRSGNNDSSGNPLLSISSVVIGCARCWSVHCYKSSTLLLIPPPR
jgi:hypothetical protein